MRTALLGGLVLAILAFAAPASAGCWATVGLAPPPATVAAGDVWTAEVTVLQHGRYPLPGEVKARPTVTIVNADGGEQRTFPAKATDRKGGLYTAEVVFPSNGRWSYEVYDGFDNWNGEPAPCATTHTFASVDVGGGPTAASSGPPKPPASSGSGSGFPAWPVAGGIAGALAAAAALAFLLRRRGPRAPASV